MCPNFINYKAASVHVRQDKDFRGFIHMEIYLTSAVSFQLLPWVHLKPGQQSIYYLPSLYFSV